MRDFVDRIKRLARVSRYLRVFRGKDVRILGGQPVVGAFAQPKRILVIGDAEDFCGKIEVHPRTQQEI